MAMAILKSVLTFVAVFTLFGGILGTMTAPSMVMGELCGFSKDASNISKCSETVDKATSAVLRYQRYGAMAGGGIGLGLGIAWNVVRRKKNAAAAAKAP